MFHLQTLLRPVFHGLAPQLIGTLGVMVVYRPSFGNIEPMVVYRLCCLAKQNLHLALLIGVTLKVCKHSVCLAA